jgi:hypothetical protein
MDFAHIARQLTPQ